MPRTRRTSHSRLLALALAVLVSGSIASQTPASAQTADPDFWQTDGSVVALAVDGNNLYIGGIFSFVGPWSGGAVNLDASTAAALGTLAGVRGEVLAAAEDGAGGFYIGGQFDRVGGQPRANLARIHSNGSLAAWNPGSNGVVRSIAVGGDVYIGGDFTQVQNKNRARIAAIDPVTGVATNWNPSANGTVRTLVLQGSNVYAGGDFTDIGGQTRSGLAALLLTNGNATTWAPNPNGAVYALVSDGVTLWAGGEFTTIALSSRSRLASFTLPLGTLTPWDPSAGGRVEALAFSGLSMYVGGAFTTLGGQPRGRLGAVDMHTGDLLAFNGASNQDVQSLLVQSGTVYAGGKFSSIGGQTRHFLGALDPATGLATSWAPSLDAPVRVLAGSPGPNVFVGGAFRLFGGVRRQNLAAIDLTTKVATAWDPGANSFVEALTVGGGKLYAGGGFSALAGQLRTVLGAFDLPGGALSSWNANVLPWCHLVGGEMECWFPRVEALQVRDGSLIVGGTFGGIGGQPRKHLGAVDLETALATSWDPGLNHTAGSTPQCFAIDADGQHVYVGGEFTEFTGQPRLNFAGLDATSAGVTSGSPDPNARVYALETSGTTVYAGGVFSQFDGQPRGGLAAIDAGSGVLLPWAPVLGNDVYSYGHVYALTLDGLTMYVGGDFNGIGGSTRMFVGAVDAVTGNVLAWNPSADDWVEDILVAGDRVILAGQFGMMGGEARRGFAVFDALPVVGVTPGGETALAPRVLSSAPSPAVAGSFLRFTLPRAASVSLALYDVAGKRVRTIVERRAFEAGEQRVPLEAGLAPGLYFLRLEAGGQVAQGKVVVAG